jgi:putative ATP-dependent endonuclease of the OLD family
MKADSIKFRGHRCFKKEWAGFDSILPVNVVIGRNNTGKSHLLDLAAAISEGKLNGRGWSYRFAGLLDADSLRVFAKGTNGGELGGNHWDEHGQHFLGQLVTWETDVEANPTDLYFDEGFDYNSYRGPNSTNARLDCLRRVVKNVQHKLSGLTFRRLLADRDIRSEAPDNTLKLLPDGTGATNIIRRYIVTSKRLAQLS